MKQKIILGAMFTGTLLLFAGCVLTSVYPYYTAKDVIFEPKLVGRWDDLAKPDATNVCWEFTRTGTNNSYTLVIQGDEKPVTFLAHLFRLKEWTFLDALPTEDHDDYVPPHYLLKITQFEPTLKTETLDYKWVSDLLEKQPGALQHLRMDPRPGDQSAARLLVTAPTAELQKFIIKHANNTNAFTEAYTLKLKP